MKKYNIEDLVSIKIIDKKTKEVVAQKDSYQLGNIKNINPHKELITDVQGKELI